ncbi:XRE family transcriptional regulator [Azoarcus communis]|uniref:XRE family transcriptional regulator n=2 Tax=Parazoarcus communis TaxID=41977 RepID=A0A323UUM2_9RHOO|nr:XRE family transcriptional regulator [Azoarcus communis] [Parazoarcus communis SWub3 = DSM 12120]
MTNFDSGALRRYRFSRGMTQKEFWRIFGITQSGGCRYESGRDIPEPVQILLGLVLSDEGEAQRLLGKLRAEARERRDIPRGELHKEA